MSFVDEEDVLGVTEGLMARFFREALGRELALPLPRLTYKESFEKYGTDAPDLRFGLELRDISDVAAGCGFRVFSEAVAQGGQVRGLCLPGGADMPRSQVDALVEAARQLGTGGLAWFKLRGGAAEGGIAKFLTEGELRAIRERFGAEDGALVLLVADRRQTCNLVLSQMRRQLARDRGLIPADTYALCWVVEAPAFEMDELAGRLTFAHHPFTMPKEEDLDRLESDPTSVSTRSYDLVLNGQEIAGGSIRIADREVQMRVLSVLGYSREQVEERFGFLVTALRYGPPPHGGIAFGFDRTVMTLLGLEDIRETIAFPKTQRAVCLLTNAPSPVDQAQLKELGLSLDAG
jgi:aspartyl-tRNA synthetase